MDGLLVIDKPRGPTSHDVVARMRRALGERRIGHTGTLDPIATGVLPLVLGRATRLAQFLAAGDKTYEVEIALGVATDTYDAEGDPIGPRHAGAWPARDAIERTLQSFAGTFAQQPPAFSAKKIDGRRSYEIARARKSAAAETPDRPAPVPVTVRSVELLDCAAGDRLSVRVTASAGFYVRSLAHDLGQRLGVGAHVTMLRRTRSGETSLADALALDAAEANPQMARAAIIPLDRMLPELPAVVLTEDGTKRARHGQDLASSDVTERHCSPSPAGAAMDVVRLLDGDGHLFGIARRTGRSELLHPSVILM